MGDGKMSRIGKKKVNGQTYTGIKPLRVEIPLKTAGEWQPIFFIESKLFYSFTDWALFLFCLLNLCSHLSNHKICRLLKFATWF